MAKYSKEEIEAYVTKRLHSFNKKYFTKYVIIQFTKKKSYIPYLYLVDRSRFSFLSYHWSADSGFAKIYDSREDAQADLDKLKYGELKIKQIGLKDIIII